jgi:protein-L-isoaspartate(D-aspartate) O-methyltransferase
VEKADWDKLINVLCKEGVLHTPKVANSLRAIPRSKFLPASLKVYNTSETPLQIGFGQTVPTPRMVAMMNEALDLQVGHKVLEVGAGSGWQAATIAEVVAPRASPRSEWGHVYAIEIIRGLAEGARRNVMNAGYGDRVTIVNGDGSKGYYEKAPYERIVVTASVPKAPKPLLDQLKTDGVLLIPVGSPTLFQSLVKITKQKDGVIREETLGSVTLAPLVGEFGNKI